MTHEDRQHRIDRYAEGPAAVAAALADVPPAQLTAHPLPGKWSAAQIVHHLADSESVAAGRLRQLLAEEAPVLHAFDQDEYARALRYEARDIVPALAVLHAVHAHSVQLLRALDDAQWARAGTHTERGRYSVEDWLTIYGEHAHKHAAQIRALADALAAAR